MYRVYLKLVNFYLEVKEKFFKFVLVEEKFFLYKGRVIHYYKSNWFGYLFVLNKCLWYFYFLIYIYHDIYSIYILISLGIFVILFYNLWLPNIFIEFCLFLFIVANDKNTTFYLNVFSYCFILILFGSTYLGVSALPFLRILFSLKTFTEIIGFCYKMHIKIQEKVLDYNIIKDNMLFEIMFPIYSQLTEEDLLEYIKRGELTEEEVEKLKKNISKK
jgi:hypothetical protein